MKKLLLSLAAAAALLMPFNAQAAEKTGIYIAPKFVWSTQHTEAHHTDENNSSRILGFNDASESNVGFAFAIGYDFAPKLSLPLRAEIEYGTCGDASNTCQTRFEGLPCKTTVTLDTVMLNLYWNMTEFYSFTPYVSAGLGAAIIDTDFKYMSRYETVASGSNKETVFAWQLGFGISYAFNDTFSADLGYRFLMADDGKAGIGKDSDFPPPVKSTARATTCIRLCWGCA